MSDNSHGERFAVGFILMIITGFICLIAGVIVSGIWDLIQEHGSIIILRLMAIFVVAYLFGFVEDRYDLLDTE